MYNIFVRAILLKRLFGCVDFSPRTINKNAKRGAGNYIVG
jgi:hypothetical protein